MKPSEVHEALVALYLRLNGYFTTGLILHSDKWGEARTEIDCLAIRHPHHAQPERGVETAEFLGTSNKQVDLLVCEVKSREDELIFNKPIRTDPEILCATLRWSGVFAEEQVQSVATRLQPLLQLGTSAGAAREGVVEGICRVRPLLCCPPCKEGGNRWCLIGSEIFSHIDLCFNPPARRDICSTQYNFRQWGYPFTPIVQYFKQKPKRPTLTDLYDHLKVP